MQPKNLIITKDGLQKIVAELEYLQTVRRKEIGERIKDSISFGGELSDNAEFAEAKTEQAHVEGRIAELKQILSVVRVSDDFGDGDVVTIGSIVRVRDLELFDETEWTIVSTVEADPSENRISNESPVGERLIGARVGDIISIDIPAGSVSYEVISIGR